MKKILRVTGLVIVGLAVVASLFLLSIVSIRAVNRRAHRVMTPGGIDEGIVVNIGGIKQYLYLRGKDRDNPIIVVLHGGPGGPLTPFIYTYQGDLERDYVLVNWDQRNAGKTYYLNDASQVFDTLDTDRMVQDLKEIVEYLSAQFGQEKVVIMGHSWGSALGTVFVQRYPELVSAYIGVGQVVNSIEGDILAHATAKQAAKQSGNKKDIETFSNLHGYLLSDSDYSPSSFATGRKLVRKYLSPLPDHAIRDLLFSPYYSLKETLFFLKSSYDLQQPLLSWLVNEFDVRDYGTKYEVPVFYILGDSDWTTPSVLAQEFFQNIEAPHKELVLIPDAGHNTMIDNPSDFCEAVLSVLDYISK